MSAQPQVHAPKTVRVTIDGVDLIVPDGTLVVEAAKLIGVNIPVYCYHPKMDPVGLCRICLVEIEKTPKLQIACSTRVADGMVVHTATPKVAEGRRGVMEFLLINHPLDCPICDKGGECDLQDFAMTYGAGASRYTEPKLHKPKAVSLGPTIVLDEERCILCRRCTRFDAEIAQERNLVVVERGQGSLIATRDGTEYTSYFSGNTTEICPVGALTSKAYRFRARPWDLGRTDSVCTQCSVGCNFRLDTRFGRIMRTYTRENPAVDGGWLCDRGRYTFNYLYEPSRLRQPLLRRDGELQPASYDEALAMTAERLSAAAGGRVGVIGGGRLADEEAYALQKFAREILGTSNIDYRAHQQKFASPARFGAAIADLDDASLILMFGAAAAEQTPVLDLRLRRAVARRGADLMYVGSYRPELAVPARFYGYTPGVITGLVERLADVVHHGKEEGRSFISEIAEALANAEKIIAIHNGRDAAAAAALERLMQTLAYYDHQVGILVLGATGNARGAEAAGCVPNLGPGYAQLNGQAGMTTGEMLLAAAQGELDALFIAGANPALTYPDGALARAALQKVPFLAVVDQFLTETGAFADVIFAAAGFAEKSGHVSNLEGRRQEFRQAVEPPLGVFTDAQVLADIARAMGRGGLSPEFDSLFAELVKAEQSAARPSSKPLPRPKIDHVSYAPDLVAGRLVAGRPEVAQGDLRSPGYTPGYKLQIIPIPRLYAGGGAAAYDPGTRPMRPKPTAMINPEDAKGIGINSGDRIRLSGRGGEIEVEAVVGDQAPLGRALVIADLPEAPVNKLTDASGFGFATIAKVDAARRAHLGEHEEPA